MTYIGDAGNPLSLEFTVVQLLNGGSQVGSSLKLDKATSQS